MFTTVKIPIPQQWRVADNLCESFKALAGLGGVRGGARERNAPTAPNKILSPRYGRLGTTELHSPNDINVLAP